ncbi:MAG: DUF2339 domain-containing protein [Planctomycetes bacterium]|nr:DUF2339 domain-containing protein [Planctomycetota bacterium]
MAHLHHAPAPDASLLPSLLPALLGLAAFGAAAWTTRGEDEANARWSWHAAALAAALVLVFGPEYAPSSEPYLWEAWLVTLGVTALVLLPAARRANGAWYALALAAYGLRRAHWLSLLLWDPQRAPLAGGLWLLEVAALGAFAALPLALRRGLGARATTAAGLAVFLFLSYGLHGRLLDAHFDGDHVWQAPAALGLLALGLGLVGRLRLGRGARDGWARAQLAVAAFWLALALTRGLAPDHHEAVATLALAGAGLVALWRWLPALWLKLAALALTAFSVATLGLELGRAFGGDDVFEGGAWLAWNWTSYATALPALAALVGAVAWSRHERAHLVNGEVQLLRGRRAWAATVAGLATAGLVFLWLNLQVYVWFEPGAWLRLDEPYGQARDLTLSIVWVLYALGLLAIGMARRAGGLRQVSLAFLLLTLVKVFLRDLGDLEGLYRVGSLFGLALSLLLVSLLYQRFVFPRRSRTGEAVEGGVA